MTYQIEWIPAEAVEALADKRGRPSPDDSAWDYCEPDEAAMTTRAQTFAAAQDIARAKLDGDWFGQVRIERVVQIQRIIGGRRGIEWEADAVWHLSAPDEALDETAPEYCPELFLDPGERILGS
jgi:hypothetical protein